MGESLPELSDMEELWTPPDARVVPEVGKKDGGSYFDDELETKAERDEKVRVMAIELIKHLNARPDHIVYVGSSDERHKMRAVLNSWKMGGLINHFPTIKIDYGVAEGAVRVDEDRS